MKELPYEVFISKDAHREAEAWCREQFGKRWEAIGNRTGIWCCFWSGFRDKNAGKYRYYFQNERDYLMFILRWT